MFAKQYKRQSVSPWLFKGIGCDITSPVHGRAFSRQSFQREMFRKLPRSYLFIIERLVSQIYETKFDYEKNEIHCQRPYGLLIHWNQRKWGDGAEPHDDWMKKGYSLYSWKFWSDKRLCACNLKARLHMRFLMRFRCDFAHKTCPSLPRTGF